MTGLAGQSKEELELAFLTTGLQLFGEEVLTILPFLAIMSLLSMKTSLGRKSIILWAWVLSAVIFGLVHLPSYNWNLLQCLVVIGSARLVLSLAYIKTKNIWVSTGDHILNDWTIFAFTIFVGSLSKVA